MRPERLCQTRRSGGNGCEVDREVDGDEGRDAPQGGLLRAHRRGSSRHGTVNMAPGVVQICRCTPLRLALITRSGLGRMERDRIQESVLCAAAVRNCKGRSGAELRPFELSVPTEFEKSVPDENPASHSPATELRVLRSRIRPTQNACSCPALRRDFFGSFPYSDGHRPTCIPTRGRQCAEPT
jgi:hypothetical protein